MNAEDLTARIERLETRLRNTEIALGILLVMLGGFMVVREQGWLPVKGSSLEIADQGHSVLTVRRS